MYITGILQDSNLIGWGENISFYYSYFSRIFSNLLTRRASALQRKCVIPHFQVCRLFVKQPKEQKHIFNSASQSMFQHTVCSTISYSTSYFSISHYSYSSHSLTNSLTLCSTNSHKNYNATCFCPSMKMCHPTFSILEHNPCQRFERAEAHLLLVGVSSRE